MSIEIKTQTVVLGGGPGGYSAAFRCADLGLETVLVERYPTLGGVCLNTGCIPSKALLHIAKIIKETRILNQNGIIINNLQLNIDKLQSWKKQIISRLNISLNHMTKARNIKIINGYGKFTSTHTLQVNDKNNITTIMFDNAIIAAGSHPIKLPFFSYEDSRIWDSTDALTLTTVPKRLLIIGGGIIGLEMATVYNALGSKIDIVEMLNQIIPEADEDIINVFTKEISSDLNLIMETNITNVNSTKDGIYVTMEGAKKSKETKCYDNVLIAIGRAPNGKLLNADLADVKIDDKGFIIVDKQMRTSKSHIYAIGDIVGQPMLAHKSTYEGHIAAEVISGLKHYFDPKVIPSIAYTDPEIAWVGITEKQAKLKGINYKVATFPWLASGRAIIANCQNGITKLLFNKETNQIIGGAVVGVNGGELLGEISLAIEMGCDAEDIALTIHAHPTYYESIGLASEIYEGTITNLFNIKLRKFF